MCTVTYIPSSEGFVLTSTRDEVVHRQTISPAFYEIDGRNLLFPKDLESSGSWIVTDGEHLSVCLLNGAWTNHQKLPIYRMSRGLIPLKVFDYQSLERFVKEFDFNEIEPFTLVAIQETPSGIRLNEMRWDGQKSFFKELNPSISYLWSSYTLYPPPIQEKRNSSFKKFIVKDGFSSPERIRGFHLQKDFQNPGASIFRQVQEGPKSVSLTQLIRNCSALDVSYYDLLAQKENHLSIKSPICL